MNNGAWFFVEPRINAILKETHGSLISYAGRKPSAATATGEFYYLYNKINYEILGSGKRHVKELDEFLAQAFGEKH